MIKQKIIAVEESLGEFLVFCHFDDQKDAHDEFTDSNPNYQMAYRFFKDGLFVLAFRLK